MIHDHHHLDGMQEREMKSQMASIEAAARQAMALDKLGLQVGYLNSLL